MQQPSFIAIDWGTSSFRLWAISGDGRVIAAGRSDQGMSSLKRGDYADVLTATLTELGIPQGLPTIICGMAGAAQGWKEAPYIDTPTRLEDIPAHAVSVSETESDVRILPGLAQRDAHAPDVLRGEETLILGAVLTRGVSGSICLPGTHSKWVTIKDARVETFSTSMTGEIYSLLKFQSVLAHSVDQTTGNDDNDQAFQSAVCEAFASPEKILQALFSVRSTALLHTGVTGQDMRARLSGLLLGLEIAGIKDTGSKQVTLICGGQLAQQYERALKITGFQYEQIDAEEMVLAGLCFAANSIWPELKAGRQIDT